ncbi:MAG: UDP-N-acetylmuramoyl-L-alanine--D-glutamate ligase [Fibrobacterota bacterium]
MSKTLEKKEMAEKTKYSGCRAAVIGMARSGIAAAGLLRSRGCSVLVSDTSEVENLHDEIALLEAAGSEFETGGNSSRVLEAGFIVVSPGVPLNIPVLKKASEKKIEIISEVELAFRNTSAEWIAVTGSNGKTTVTTLIGKMLEASGISAAVCGNIGVPVSEVIQKGKDDGIIVSEISSFQLEAVKSFKPGIALLLNLTPDHLDRYSDVDDYYRTKLKIFGNDENAVKGIINAEDPVILKYLGERKEKFFGFSIEDSGMQGVFISNGAFVCRRDNRLEKLMDVDRLKIKGRHNMQNAAAAFAASIMAGAKTEAAAYAAGEFTGVNHRLEYCGSIKNVDFYNDSKATNTASMETALKSFEKPVVLIAGGRDKGGDFSSLRDLVSEKCTKAVLSGEAAGTIKNAWEGAIELEFAHDMNDAVNKAFRNSSRNGVILLSPGCASFDAYKNYEERGEHFKRVFNSLRKENE